MADLKEVSALIKEETMSHGRSIISTSAEEPTIPSIASKKRPVSHIESSQSHSHRQTNHSSKAHKMMSSEDNIRKAIALGLRHYGDRLIIQKQQRSAQQRIEERPRVAEPSVEQSHRTVDPGRKTDKSSITVLSLNADADIDIVPAQHPNPLQRNFTGLGSRPPAYLIQTVNEIDARKAFTVADEDWQQIDKDATTNALYAHSQLNLNSYTEAELDHSMKSIYCNLSYLVQTLQPKGWKWPENKTRFEFLSRCNFREFSKSIFMMQARMRNDYKESNSQLNHMKKLLHEFNRIEGNAGMV
eukprot:TRINITY_DN5618_c0_g1_i3.p1 TRINITY_DN5618_c0_g1~~TRINITY_DN5618_c0_g1_i3.p1  ORF type:complete len:300 (-),score=48.36 TRINITY_DN5618_c0_g1_i3:104-1003(-)